MSKNATAAVSRTCPQSNPTNQANNKDYDKFPNLFTNCSDDNNNGNDDNNNGADDNGDGTADASADATSTAAGATATESSSTRYAVITHSGIKFNPPWLARVFPKPISTPR